MWRVVRKVCVAPNLLVFRPLFCDSVQKDTLILSLVLFDRNRDGFGYAGFEGGCSLILRARSIAKARGAKIYAEIRWVWHELRWNHCIQPNVLTPCKKPFACL